MTIEIPNHAKVAQNYQETGKKVEADPELARNLLKNSSVTELRKIAILEGGTGCDDDVEALKKLAENISSLPTSPASSPDHRT